MKTFPNHNCNIKYNLLMGALHYLEFVCKQMLYYLFHFFLLVFQFFLPGNIKNSTVCKILLMLFSLFFFSLFCQPHQITQVIEHEWLCKLTLAVPRQHYQQAWRKCWLWWKRTHLQIKLHIIRAILVPIFSQVKDYIGFSLFSLFNFCSHIFDFFFKKKSYSGDFPGV